VTDLPSSSDSDGMTYGITAEFRADSGKKYISLNSYRVIEWIHPQHFQQLEIESMSSSNNLHPH
jgi:hypothetical protein